MTNLISQILQQVESIKNAKSGKLFNAKGQLLSDQNMSQWKALLKEYPELKEALAKGDASQKYVKGKNEKPNQDDFLSVPDNKKLFLLPASLSQIIAKLQAENKGNANETVPVPKKTVDVPQNVSRSIEKSTSLKKSGIRDIKTIAAEETNRLKNIKEGEKYTVRKESSVNSKSLKGIVNIDGIDRSKKNVSVDKKMNNTERDVNKSPEKIRADILGIDPALKDQSPGNSHNTAAKKNKSKTIQKKTISTVKDSKPVSVLLNGGDNIKSMHTDLPLKNEKVAKKDLTKISKVINKGKGNIPQGIKDVLVNTKKQESNITNSNSIQNEVVNDNGLDRNVSAKIEIPKTNNSSDSKLKNTQKTKSDIPLSHRENIIKNGKSHNDIADRIKTHIDAGTKKVVRGRNSKVVDKAEISQNKSPEQEQSATVVSAKTKTTEIHQKSNSDINEITVNRNDKPITNIKQGTNSHNQNNDNNASSFAKAVNYQNIETAKQQIPARIVKVIQKEVSASKSLQMEQWQQHKFVMDDGKSISIALKQNGGVLHLQIGSQNADMSKLLQQQIQDIRMHLREHFNLEIDLQFQNQGQQGQGSGRENMSRMNNSNRQGQIASLAGNGITNSTSSIAGSQQGVRFLGFNRNEWTG